jgi:hypothetical protein
MAQSGYTPISLYYSTVTGNIPPTGNLVSGELGINIRDGKLYYKNAAGTVTLLANSAITFPLAVSNGGTGQTTYTDGQLLIGNSTGNTLTKASLTAGSGVTITPGSGSITISATGLGGTVTSVSFTGGIISVATATTTPALTVAGTSGGVVYFSSASTWASSAALASNALVVGGGAGNAPATVTTGTGVVTALGVNTETAGAFVVNGGALGTPSSGTVTNLTGTAAINITGTAPAGTLTGTTLNSTVVTSSLTTVGTIGTGVWQATAVGATYGGTGQTSYAVGDLLYASTTTALSKLADVATGNALISGGVGVAPSYGKIGLTTHISGTLAVGNGGTGATTLTGLVVGNGTSAMTTVAAPSGTIVGTTDTQTLTNKRINLRVQSQASTATLAINSDSYDQSVLTAQAASLSVSAPTGTPVNGQKLTIRIKDNGTARAITWTTTSGGFRAVGAILPTTTVVSKVVYVGAIYNSDESFWDVVSVAQQV